VAKATPRPDDAPVTTTTLSCTENKSVMAIGAAFQEGRCTEPNLRDTERPLGG